jgi:hypothetical protein
MMSADAEAKQTAVLCPAHGHLHLHAYAQLVVS